MRLIKAGPFPVRGLPLFLFSMGVIGISVAWYVSRLTGLPVEPFFILSWALSLGMGAKIGDGKLVLLYGFWFIRQEIDLSSIEEISLLSRLDRGSITRHFKAYSLTWLAVVLWALADLVILNAGNNGLRLYMDVFVISTFTVFFLAQTLPKSEKTFLRLAAFVCAAFLVAFPLYKWGPKTLIPGAFFVLLIVFIVKTFQKGDLILIVADGKSYLLSSDRGVEVLKLIREAMRNA
ncbi:hypothetical protein CDI07_00390 [Thermococcus sp. 5-4]|nr:hypothetical protein CDI07_00390 [Thermococcus sp. 5-4]